jgi:F420-dependent oxidoreductase-like protein
MIMKLSIAVTNFTWPGGPSRIAADLGRLVRQADEGGIHTVWVADHLVQAEPGTQLTDPMLEAYTTLGYLAGITSRVRLGTAVSAVTFREPALLIKAVTTLDVLSGGRAWLGIGAGYLQDEANMMGLPLPPTAERFERLEEALRLAVQMWAGDDAAFEGKHTRLSRPINSPASLSRPHPPIMIGGSGEKKTLRLVARYAQACNLFDIPDGGATIRHKLQVLADHCEAENRPYAEIEKTVATRLGPDETPGAFAERAAGLAALGAEHLNVLNAGPWNPEALARLTAAVPLVEHIQPG